MTLHQLYTQNRYKIRLPNHISGTFAFVLYRHKTNDNLTNNEGNGEAEKGRILYNNVYKIISKQMTIYRINTETLLLEAHGRVENACFNYVHRKLRSHNNYRCIATAFY